MATDWQDFSVSTDLEHLVATLESVLSRLKDGPVGISRDQFVSPAGIQYVLSFVRRTRADVQGAAADVTRAMWMARTALAPEISEPEDARLLALCEWSCYPVAAVITHATTASDFFGEITATQATTLMSALQLALSHVGLGGAVPAIVQIYEPSRGAFIGCWPPPQLFPAEPGAARSSSVVPAPSFVRFKSDATLFFLSASTPAAAAAAAGPSSKAPADAYPDPLVSAFLPPLPLHLATSRGALVQFCTRLLPPHAIATLLGGTAPPSAAVGAAWEAYRRRLGSAGSGELCAAFSVVPSLRLGWWFDTAPTVSAALPVGPGSSSGADACTPALLPPRLLPEGLARVEVYALWSALPQWRQRRLEGAVAATGGHMDRPAHCQGCRGEPPSGDIACSAQAVAAAIDADSGWAATTLSGGGGRGAGLRASDLLQCTALAMRVHWSGGSSSSGGGGGSTAVQRFLHECSRRGWSNGGEGDGCRASSPAAFQCCLSIDEALPLGPPAPVPVRPSWEGSVGRGAAGEAGALPLDDAWVAGGGGGAGPEPSAWFPGAALLSAVASHALVQAAADAAASVASSGEYASSAPAFHTQAEESAAAYGLAAWASMPDDESAGPFSQQQQQQPGLALEAEAEEEEDRMPADPGAPRVEEKEGLPGEGDLERPHGLSPPPSPPPGAAASAASGGGGSLSQPKAEGKGPASASIQRRPTSPFSPLRSPPQQQHQPSSPGSGRLGGARRRHSSSFEPSSAAVAAAAAIGISAEGLESASGGGADASATVRRRRRHSVAASLPYSSPSATADFNVDDDAAEALSSPPAAGPQQRSSRFRAALRRLPGAALGRRLRGALVSAAKDIAASAAATLPSPPPQRRGDGREQSRTGEGREPRQALDASLDAAAVAASPALAPRRLAATAAAWGQQEALTEALAASCAFLATRGAVAKAVAWVFSDADAAEVPGLAARLELAFSALCALAIRRAPELQRGGMESAAAAEAGRSSSSSSRWAGVASRLTQSPAPAYGALRMRLARADGIGSGVGPGSAAPPSMLQRLAAAAASAVAASGGDADAADASVMESEAEAARRGCDALSSLAAHASLALLCTLWHAFVAECRRLWDGGAAALPHTGSRLSPPASAAPSLLQQWLDLLALCMKQRAAGGAPGGGVRAGGCGAPQLDSDALRFLAAAAAPRGLPLAPATPLAARAASRDPANASLEDSALCDGDEDDCFEDAQGAAEPPLVHGLELRFPGGAAAAAALLRGGDDAMLLLGDGDDEDSEEFEEGVKEEGGSGAAAAACEDGSRSRRVVSVSLRLLRSPALQPPPPRRTDLHEAEDARALAALGLAGLRSRRRDPTGSGGGGLSLRVLLADMRAFRAANPGRGRGVALADFLRWYCPPELLPRVAVAAAGPGGAADSGGAAAGGALLSALEAAEDVSVVLAAAPPEAAAPATGPTDSSIADHLVVGAALGALRAAHCAAPEGGPLGGLRVTPRLVPPLLTRSAAAAGVPAALPLHRLVWSIEAPPSGAALLLVWRSMWEAAAPPSATAAAAAPGTSSSAATPSAARRAALPPALPLLLFDPAREGELALHALETLSATDVAGQLVALAAQRVTARLGAAAAAAAAAGHAEPLTSLGARVAADAAAALGEAAVQVHGAALQSHSRGASTAAASARAQGSATGDPPDGASSRAWAAAPLRLVAASLSLQRWYALAGGLGALQARTRTLADALAGEGDDEEGAADAARLSLAAALVLGRAPQTPGAPEELPAPPLLLAECAGARTALLRLLLRCQRGAATLAVATATGDGAQVSTPPAPWRGSASAAVASSQAEPQSQLLPPPHQRTVSLASAWVAASSSSSSCSAGEGPRRLPLGAAPGHGSSPIAGEDDSGEDGPAAPVSTLVVASSYGAGVPVRGGRVGVRVSQALRLQGL